MKHDLFIASDLRVHSKCQTDIYYLPKCLTKHYISQNHPTYNIIWWKLLKLRIMNAYNFKMSTISTYLYVYGTFSLTEVLFIKNGINCNKTQTFWKVAQNFPVFLLRLIAKIPSNLLFATYVQGLEGYLRNSFTKKIRWGQNFEIINELHSELWYPISTLWKNEKFTFTIIFPWNKLFSNLFSKCVVFTKFFRNSVRVNFRNFHTTVWWPVEKYHNTVWKLWKFTLTFFGKILSTRIYFSCF